jgi:hypothetical protein
VDPDPDSDRDPAVFFIDLQDANKKRILKKFPAYYFLKAHLHHFTMVKSPNEVTKQKESRFSLLNLLDDRRIRIREAQKHVDPDPDSDLDLEDCSGRLFAKGSSLMPRLPAVCERGKVHKHASSSTPRHFARRFSHVHVDRVGPLPASSEGHVYLLTAIDRPTRCVEALPLRNTDAFIANSVARF